jgi:hypothetical protein
LRRALAVERDLRRQVLAEIGAVLRAMTLFEKTASILGGA